MCCPWRRGHDVFPREQLMSQPVVRKREQLLNRHDFIVRSWHTHDFYVLGVGNNRTHAEDGLTYGNARRCAQPADGLRESHRDRRVGSCGGRGPPVEGCGCAGPPGGAVRRNGTAGRMGVVVRDRKGGGSGRTGARLTAPFPPVHSVEGGSVEWCSRCLFEGE